MFSIILDPPSLTASVHSLHAYTYPPQISQHPHLSSNPSSPSHPLSHHNHTPLASTSHFHSTRRIRILFQLKSAAGILRMACASQALVAAFSARTFPKKSHRISSFLVRASVDDSDCNVEECAPDKEVGKISVEWLAGEKTRVVGTYPPRKKGWTGYVEKDTAGQTNIYSVEPAVYVAESAISSGSAGTSADGSERTATIAASIAFISIAAACVIVLQVGKTTTPSQPQTLEYSGPTLTYYINKFKPTQEVVIQASMPGQPESVLTDLSSSPLLE